MLYKFQNEEDRDKIREQFIPSFMPANLRNYERSLQKLAKYANAHPKEKILFVQVVAGLSALDHQTGEQVFLTNEKPSASAYLTEIKVESLVAEYAQQLPNVYFLTIFQCASTSSLRNPNQPNLAKKQSESILPRTVKGNLLTLHGDSTKSIHDFIRFCDSQAIVRSSREIVFAQIGREPELKV
jgi:hypothetical protein